MASKSRAARWADAVAQGRDALDAISAAWDDLHSALGDLEDLRVEYEDWLGNMPDFAQGSATYDLLQTVVDLSFDSSTDDVDEASQMLDDAEGAELPRGFGRD